MEPENPPPPPAGMQTEEAAQAALRPEAREYLDLQGVFLGGDGLRAGWAVLFFFMLSGFPGHAGVFNYLVGTAFYLFHLISAGDDFSAASIFWGELSVVLPLAGAAVVLAFIEGRRNLLAYNLTGTRRAHHLFSGLAVGFTALSALVGVLALGGWLRIAPSALSGAEMVKEGALWAGAFLLVGCFEEGTFRCFLQFTLTRGINFWWALGTVGPVCLYLLLTSKGNGVWGVYAAALLGLLPCLWLQVKKVPAASFWQAAWVTSTLFGFVHLGNNGENWIGIFAAALIGFVFCVSVRVTGSAWWAIGCHAAWDWAETFFYGTPNSGMVTSGHMLSATPAGNTLWCGGADGPEGSLLALGIILLLLAAVVVIYGRKKAELAAE